MTYSTSSLLVLLILEPKFLVLTFLFHFSLYINYENNKDMSFEYIVKMNVVWVHCCCICLCRTRASVGSCYSLYQFSSFSGNCLTSLSSCTLRPHTTWTPSAYISLKVNLLQSKGWHAFFGYRITGQKHTRQIQLDGQNKLDKLNQNRQNPLILSNPFMGGF